MLISYGLHVEEGIERGRGRQNKSVATLEYSNPRQYEGVKRRRFLDFLFVSPPPPRKFQDGAWYQYQAV